MTIYTMMMLTRITSIRHIRMKSLVSFSASISTAKEGGKLFFHTTERLGFRYWPLIYGFKQ